MEEKAKELRKLLAGRKNIRVSEVRSTYIRIENDMDCWRESIEDDILLPFCKRNGLYLIWSTSMGSYDYLITKIS